MKKLSSKRFEKLIKIGMSAILGIAVIVVFCANNCVSLRDSTILESVPSSISSSSKNTASSDEAPRNANSAADSTPTAGNSSAVSSPTRNSPININTATSEELQTLSGIGQAKAAAIIAYREQHGVFSNISEIMNVSGIGESIFENIRNNITTGADIATLVENSSVSSAPTENSPININTATSEELQTLSGIGQVKAAAIIAYREQHGAFSDISEIMNVSGIGEKIFEKIREKITV